MLNKVNYLIVTKNKYYNDRRCIPKSNGMSDKCLVYV